MSNRPGREPALTSNSAGSNALGRQIRIASSVTVRNQLSAVFATLRVSGRVQVALLARDAGIP
ncbi:hypothetical protein [Micromonospora avicenniae]|uniref:hypothetical protein n=1 Tax=Micromonospora avicenniae TaxID=1198245 RepID=UPI00332EC4CD